MGTKGQSQTSNNTQQQQTYQPNPAAMGYINDALGRAGQTANLPFSIPQAPVAGFSPQQQQAFNLVGNAQGQAQPYYDQANQYFAKSAQGPDVSQFFNPYAGAVTANLKDIFGQQQSQQTGQLTQAAGGVGADRIGVGQSELAKQQGLTAGQTLANLYAPSLSAAQQQQQMLQSAGYGTAALGSASQNAALTGANALLGAGGLQQQLSQAQLNSPYQQQIAQAAFPYQQSQFYTGAVGALAPGMGGTTSGYGTSNGTATPAQPSMFSQILGAGTAGAGIYGGFGGFNGGKGGGNPAYGGDGTFGSGNGVYGGSSSNPLPGLSASDYGAGYARGGRADPYLIDLSRRGDGSYGYDEGGTVSDQPIDISAHSIIPTGQLTPIRPNIPQLNLNPPAQSGGSNSGSNTGGDIMKGIGTAAQMAMMFLKRGGRIDPKKFDGYNPYAFAEGGGVDNSIDVAENFPGGLLDVMHSLRRAKDSQEIATGERFSDNGSRIPGQQKARNDAYTDRLRARRSYAAGGDVDDDSPATFDERFPYRMPSAGAVDNWRADANPMAFAGDDASVAVPAVRAVRAAGAGAAAGPMAAPDTQALNPYSTGSAAPPEAISERANRDTGFTGSPWAALTAAGLGMMAGTSPFAAANIGAGGLAGMKTLETQRTAAQKDETIDQATRRLAQEAKFHEDQYSRMTPYQKEEVKLQQSRDKMAWDQFNRPYEQLTKVQQQAVERQKTQEDLAREQFNRPYNELTKMQKESIRLKEDEQEAKDKPVKLGTDLLGRDILGIKDKDGKYINPLTGKPVEDSTLQVPPTYKVPGPQSEADDAELPKHARLTQGVNAPEGVNPEILAQLPPQRAATIRAIDEGRQSLTSVPLKDRASVMDQLNAYDPQFDQTTWATRNAQQKEMSTNGNAGKMILAVNQLLPHLKTASDKAQALENSNFRGGNMITNWLATQTGDPRPGNFETVREVAAMDAARLLRGSGAMAEQDIDFWRKNLASAGSPAQLQEKIAMLADDLMGARITSIQHSYRMNMRMEPPDFVSKEAKEALETIKKRNVKPGDGEKPAGVTAEPAAAAAPKVGERRQFKQGWGTWNGTGWVPE